MARSLKNYSKGDFDLDGGGVNSHFLDIVKTSSLMRIADAMESQAKSAEKMAVKYNQMERDLAYYKAGYERLGRENEKLRRSKSALKGVNTRTKNKEKK